MMGSVLLYSSAGESAANSLQSHLMGGGVNKNAARQEAVDVLELAQHGQWAQASSLSASIKDETAKTLVDWFLYRSDFPNLDFVSMANFVMQHGDWPAVDRVRAKAEKVFPDNYPDSYALNWFERYAPLTFAGVKRYAGALKRAGRGESLQKLFSDWLPSAQITPAQQAELLRDFGGFINQNTMINRFHAALLTDQYTNARAIAARLQRGYPALAEARIALSAKRKGVDGLIRKVSSHLKNDAGLMIARVKWRRNAGNIKSAASLMLAYDEKVTHPQMLKAMWNERHILIRALMEEKKYDTAYRLAKAHQQTEGFSHAQAQWMAGWLALRYEKQPMAAFYAFDELYKNVKTPISKSRGAYWAARASEALGDTKTAQIWYQAAARYPTVFYGQMALDRLAQKPDYTGVPDKGASLKQAAAWTKIRAVRLLHKAGLQSDAETFLYSLLDDAKAGKLQYVAVCQLALEVGAPNISVYMAKKAENDGVYLLKYAFPEITDITRDVNFNDHALLHGLIRQESAFDLEAKSGSGALGLMQLMPATARETAGKMGVSYSKSRLTADAAYNVKIGSTYIGKMLDRFDGSYPLAIAAYNGGPRRVSGWIKAFGTPQNLGHDDLLDWIESIPVYETRNYVQRVTEAMRVYSDLFKASGYRKKTVLAWNDVRK